MECTVNRVGDTFFDQLERTGHAHRVADLDRFADLGIRALRYPVLWERTAPHGPLHADWDWSDERLTRLRVLHIQPIVGLVHHGSGPAHTSLLDPAFPEALALFARAVAERYPWVERYTPVNEPLTTARFSGLYGHWYPHGHDELTFARALLNECRAVVLAMRAIREVNLQAQLVQTEDLGKTFSTSKLLYQAEFENERRWLSFDLLCGRVDHNHWMWKHLRWVGVPEAEIGWFLDNPCPPDIMGINYYLTSERFLDEHLERYPVHTHGSNSRSGYADVEAVRVRAEGLAGPQALLTEVWERYKLPIAITEVHNGCTREEQLRWLHEVWTAAEKLGQTGVDVRAVTAWSLLGAYDWNSLVTRDTGHYEPGIFDLRAPEPRPTALANLLQQLAMRGEADHPVLDVPGWWHRPKRLLHGIAIDKAGQVEYVASTPALLQSYGTPTSRPFLITGATGTLGQAFAHICQGRGLAYHLLSRQELDIADPDAVAGVMDRYRPWAVVNAAGFVRVDDAEREPWACYRENTTGPETLAASCAERGIKLVTFSSDLVFDGEHNRPYIESDDVTPINVYGCSKAQAERLVLKALPSALVVRTSAFFGPWDEYNFVTIALRTLASGESFVAAADACISPTYVPDLVHTAVDLLIDGAQGIWHLANVGALSWADLARLAAATAGIHPGGVIGVPTSELHHAARRPLYSVLGSERAALMPSLEDALQRYLAECTIGWQAETMGRT